MDAWHDDHYWTNRIEHLNNLFSFESACRKCEDWRGTPWNLGYEKVIQSMAMADEVRLRVKELRGEKRDRDDKSTSNGWLGIYRHKDD